MINKKIMFILIIVIGLFVISAVSAAENVTDETETVEILSSENDEIQSTQNDEILSEGSEKTFADLNETINSNTADEISLDSDYKYSNSSDSNFTEGIIIKRPVTINGNGHTIDGNLTARIFNITSSNVTLTNIIFTNGEITGMGGAIYWAGDNGTVSGCTFTSNKADGEFSLGFAGAIYWKGTDGTVKNTSFINNAANNGGAILWAGDNGTVKNTSFINNVAYTEGGAVRWDGVNARVINTTFVNNTSKGEYGDGGAIRFYGDNYRVTNSTFTNNTSDDCGAAIMGYGNNAIIVNSAFTSNRANDSGGAVYLSGNNCTVLTCMFTDNFAVSVGGALYKDDYDNTTVANCIFTNNRADYWAGAIRWIGNNGELTNSTFTNNSAKNEGGAVKWYRNNGKIADCVFTNNTVDDYSGTGGAIYWDGKNSELKNCTFTNNTAEYGGGAIYWRDNYGTLTNCTFINNFAVNSYGGAVYWCDKYGTVTNSLFINNSVNKEVGGALFCRDDNCEVSNCTFVNNTANNGSAIFLSYSDNSSVSGCYFVNNTGANTVYCYYLNSSVINYNIFLNNNGTGIVLENSTAERDYNWFGNNAANYNIKPEGSGNTWLYLNATADTNNLVVCNSTGIVFRLYCYNSTSQYNNTLLKPVNLTITSNRGAVDKNNIVLGETLTYTANDGGIGSVTATVENVKCTIQFNIKLDPDFSADCREITYPENATITLSYNQTATGKVNITLKGKKQNYTFNADLNSTLPLGKINSDEYDVTVTYSGDDRFINATATAILKVNKAQFEIGANMTGEAEGGIKTDQIAAVTIDVTNIPDYASGEIVINVSGIEKNYTISLPVTVNTVQLDIITTPGTYTLNAQYTGDDNCNASNLVTKTFKVSNWNETDLQELIGNGTGNVVLEHDYIFTNENVTVNVTSAITINANGHTIDANGSSTAIYITSDNVTIDNLTVINANGTAIASNGTNTTISNVEITNVNGTAIQIDADDSKVCNITAANITGALINVTGDRNTISNINSTGNATINVEGVENIIENVTGATVIPTIKATGIVKANNVIITANVSATEGNVIVQFHGKKYSVPLTGGKAVITIPDVGAGTYNVVVNYEGTALYQSVSTNTGFTSKVAITENRNVEIDYLTGYAVRIINAEGSYASGVIVKMTINGKTHKVKTDKNGYAKITINLKPKTYKITVQYLNIKKTNKIKVKSTIKLVKKTVKVKKTAKKIVLKAKLKWSTGKAIKGKVIKFKFKGKTYKAKTGRKGIAKATIKKKVIKKLKKGKKYKFTVKYGKEYVKGKIKVKK